MSGIIRRSSRLTSFLGVVALLCCVGCGFIADKDRIKIAKIGDRYITRGDLTLHLYRMDPEQRPQIASRGDLVRVLEKYVDREVQVELAKRLESEGKIKPDRERAEQLYMALHPEMNIDPQNPEQFGLTEADVEAIKRKREDGIDATVQDLLVNSAMVYAIEEAMKAGSLSVDDSEYEKEFEYRRNEFFNPERIKFVGLVFPMQVPECGPKSAEVRKRVIMGEAWEKVAGEFVSSRTAIPFQSVMERNAMPKFSDFWEQASGSRPGEILGPMIIQGWEIMMRDPTGKVVQNVLPAGYFVCQVVEIQPQTPMTLEEAKPLLSPELLFVKMMNRLRAENGVEIYKDKVPDPSLYDDKTKNPLAASE